MHYYWKLLIHPRFEIRKLKSYVFVLQLILAQIMQTYLVYNMDKKSFNIITAFLITQIYQTLGFLLILFHFTVSHTTTPVTNNSSDKVWIIMIIDHTINMSNHWFVNWFMGYLNFQIEHHLFPTAPQYKLPYVSDRIKQFCTKHSIQYVQLSYLQAYKNVFTNLYNVTN